MISWPFHPEIDDTPMDGEEYPWVSYFQTKPYWTILHFCRNPPKPIQGPWGITLCPSCGDGAKPDADYMIGGWTSIYQRLQQGYQGFDHGRIEMSHVVFHVFHIRWVLFRSMCEIIFRSLFYLPSSTFPYISHTTSCRTSLSFTRVRMPILRHAQMNSIPFYWWSNHV